MKIKLSHPGKSQVHQTIQLAGKSCEVALTRSRFEELIDPLIAQTLEVSDGCLKSTGLSWAHVDRLVMTGGSTLIPHVQKRVRELTGLSSEAIFTKQPHQAVTLGAALLASQRLGGDGETEHRIRQIATFNLGMRIQNREKGTFGIEPLIERNTPLPATLKKVFYTTRHEQQRIIFELVQARSLGEAPNSLGWFAFGPILKPRKNYPVEVEIHYDAEGVIRVKARDPETARELEQVFDEPEQSEAGRLRRNQALVESVRINE